MFSAHRWRRELDLQCQSSLFVTNLAFSDHALIDAYKMAILSNSVLSATVGFFGLSWNSTQFTMYALTCSAMHQRDNENQPANQVASANSVALSHNELRADANLM